MLLWNVSRSCLTTVLQCNPCPIFADTRKEWHNHRTRRTESSHHQAGSRPPGGRCSHFGKCHPKYAKGKHLKIHDFRMDDNITAAGPKRSACTTRSVLALDPGHTRGDSQPIHLTDCLIKAFCILTDFLDCAPLPELSWSHLFLWYFNGTLQEKPGDWVMRTYEGNN